MNAALLAVIALVAFGLGYRFYSRYLARSLFRLHEETGPTPAEAMSDGVDYVPAPKAVLFGHHFASIAGAAPIVGPAVAVIWGWVPAILWVIFGTIFMGAAHDFGTLVVSMKNRGQSIGQVCEDLIGPRARTLFLVVIFFLVWMVIAVFALVIANLFMSFPSSVLPVNFQIIVALAIGYFINRRKASLLAPSLIALIALIAMIGVGSAYPISIEGLFSESVRNPSGAPNTLMVWILFLMLYSFAASTLPVWLLLQPRDYINCHQLFLGLGLLILGLIVGQPAIVAPAFHSAPIGAPPIFPFLFITIACGAVSGFHGLVSSGTSSKQVSRWQDARQIGYGGMLGEGLLALLATLAVVAGFSSSEEWHLHYRDWNSANGLNAKISAFVLGSGSFLSNLGVPTSIGNTAMAVLVISFAATSLDTAARIQRYIVTELGVTWKIRVLQNRHAAGFIAVGSAFALMLMNGGGKGGLLIWPLFGATNQMLAALSLTVICLYLLKKKRNVWPYLIPVGIMACLTFLALAMNIHHYLSIGDWTLATLGAMLLSIQVWIMGEGVAAGLKLWR